MIHWIYRTKDHETLMVSLLQKISIEDIMIVLRSRRFSWYGHAQSAKSVMKFVTDIAITGIRRRGRFRKKYMVRMCEEWCQRKWPAWDWPTRQRRMESWRPLYPGAANPIEWGMNHNLNIDLDGWMDGLMDGLNANTRVSWNFLGRMSEWPWVDTWQMED